MRSHYLLRGWVTYVSLLLPLLTNCQNMTEEQKFNAKRTLSIGIVLFPGFEPLDVYGPLEILFQLSVSSKMSLSLVSFATGPVSARIPPHAMGNLPPMDVGFAMGPTTIATHTFRDAPPLDVIIVPGGIGNFILEQANNTEMEDFVARRYDQADYVLSVCTGAVTLAKAGILSGKRATTNKSAWVWTTDPIHGSNITWVPSARWVEDGKVWSSSGVAAGMDMTYAFLKQLYGTAAVDPIMNRIEYAPHQDPNWDPFSVVYEVPGADKSRSLASCVVPAGSGAQ